MARKRKKTSDRAAQSGQDRRIVEYPETTRPHHPVYDQARDGMRSSGRGSTGASRADNSIAFPADNVRRADQNRARSGENTSPRQARPSDRDRRAPNGRMRPANAPPQSPARREKRKARRMTRAAIRRRRLMRRLTAFALLLCVIAAGVYLTVTMLFKISALRVETPDGTAVETLGGYSSAQILEALGVHTEENIFSFDPAAKSEALEKVFPLLENIAVVREYPGTVVVRAEAAQPAYALQTESSWLTLSAGLKILEATSARPELPTLYGGEPITRTPGEQLAFEVEEAADSAEASEEVSDGSEAVSEAAVSDDAAPIDERLDALNKLMDALERFELIADVTRIEFEDPGQMVFLYQDRISVELGTLNELDYKLKLARYVLLNEDGKGCAATDTGVLDLSHLSASSTRQFRFAQGEPTLPSGYLIGEQTAGSAEETTETTAENAAE